MLCGGGVCGSPDWGSESVGNVGGGRGEEAAAEPGVEHIEVGFPRSHSRCADKNLRKYSIREEVSWGERSIGLRSGPSAV